MKIQADSAKWLVAVKLLHTAVWIFFAGCILAIPIATVKSDFQQAAVLTGLVTIECLVLAANRGRCPLTDLATRYSDADTAVNTAPPADNFDIYLPLWLARYNKAIFGTLFVAAEVFLVWKYFASRP